MFQAINFNSNKKSNLLAQNTDIYQNQQKSTQNPLNLYHTAQKFKSFRIDKNNAG